MNHDAIALYLNDHFAGSVGAVELVRHWAEATHGGELGDFFASLLLEIERDRVTLATLMASLAMEPSAMRNAAAWLAEKAARLKLGTPAEDGERLALLQALESLELGIAGKKALWSALRVSGLPGLEGIDFTRLEGRAVDQLALVEERRLKTAQEALCGRR